MKAAYKRTGAFTRTELIIVLAVLVVLACLFIPSLVRAHSSSSRVGCVNNMMQIGIAYRVWSNDNGDKFPDSVPQTNGGWREIFNGPNASAFAWTNYAVMRNELGLNSKILVCPTDERKPATDFALISNTNVSYFVGPGNDTYPQAILGGDRNLGPGTTPRDDYGFSPADGRGNDVTIKGSVCWSLQMHSEGKPSGAGNIMLGDGSAQQVTSGNLNVNWLKPAMEAYTNAPGGLGSTGGVRLIFP